MRLFVSHDVDENEGLEHKDDRLEIENQQEATIEEKGYLKYHWTDPSGVHSVYGVLRIPMKN